METVRPRDVRGERPPVWTEAGGGRSPRADCFPQDLVAYEPFTPRVSPFGVRVCAVSRPAAAARARTRRYPAGGRRGSGGSACDVSDRSKVRDAEPVGTW